MIYVIAAILVLAGLYLLSIRPNRGRQDRMKPFEQTYIAHRGLYDNRVIPENSLPGFQRAVAAGYGIELDVQLTTDDQLVIFHDETLERMCADKRKLHELSYAELSSLRLLDTEERIPLFRDVLEAVGGAVPMIVEIKSEGRWRDTTRLTEAMLRDYPGLYCVESFHPFVLRWYRKHSPDTIRGQLSTDYRRDHTVLPAWERFLLTNLMLNFVSRPDFIAYNCKHMRQPSFTLCRRLYRPVPVAWTVQSPEELEAIRSVFRVFIFERFFPGEGPAYQTEDASALRRDGP